MSSTVQTRSQAIIPASNQPTSPLPPALNRPRSLVRRIIRTLVVVGFLSAIVGGILYQWQVSEAVRQYDQRNRQQMVDTLIADVKNLSLPARAEERILTRLEQSKTVVNPRPVFENALNNSVWVIIVVALISSVLAWLLGQLLTFRLVKTLRRLRQASQRVAQGDFSPRVPVGEPDELGEVAFSFNLMAGQLESAEVRRRELLSDVAHELKTPLASIQGHVEALRDNLPKAKANPEAIYDIVLEDVAALDRMIGTLRTWLDTQGIIEHLELKPLSVAEELPKLAQRFEPRAESAGIHLATHLNDPNLTIMADRNALRHILSNLLDNALRYTSKGGHVRLQAWPGDGEKPGQGRPDYVTLAVSDTGVGIAPEHWAHLFERFYRVDKSRSRDTGGTGLGLALVRDLVQAQGGRVWVNSRVGHGTTFFVTLPAAPRPRP